MSAQPQPEPSQQPAKSRARANTTFTQLPWRRNKPDGSTTVASLISSPAAPVQTLPIDSLVQLLTPPSEPSLAHARSFVTALSTQTPPPPPQTLSPIIHGLCSKDSSVLIQIAGYDILATYCAVNGALSASDRLVYLSTLPFTESWSQEIWEPRLKALNALIPSAEDVIGAEDVLLCILSTWVETALDDYSSEAGTRPEKERAVEALNDAYISWFNKLEITGRMSESYVLSIYKLYISLADKVLGVTPGSSQTSSVSTSTPSTPQRENDSSAMNSPARHRRHPSSTVNIASPLSNQKVSRFIRGPAHIVTTIILNTIDARKLRLSYEFLPILIPLLFRLLSALITPLPSLSPHSSPELQNDPVELRLVRLVALLLSGPYGSTCLILVRKLIAPAGIVQDGNQSLRDTPDLERVSIGALRVLRLQVRQVLEDRMAMRLVQRDVAATATPAGAPGSVHSLNKALEERAQRAWKSEGAGVWDARKIGLYLCRSIKAWIAFTGPINKDRIFEEIASLLKDVLEELDDRLEDRRTILDRDFRDNDTGTAVGSVLSEMMNYINTLCDADGNPLIMSLDNANVASSPLLRIIASIFQCRNSLSYLNPPVPTLLLTIAQHLNDSDTEKFPSLMSQQHLLKPISPSWLDAWTMLLGARYLYHKDRPATRRAVMAALESNFAHIKEMPAYRRRFAGVVFDFWTHLIEEKNEGVDGAVVWHLLGDEVVLRTIEDETEELFTPIDETPPDKTDVSTQKILVSMISVSGDCSCGEEVEVNILSPETEVTSPVPITPSNTVASGAGSPVFSRTMTEVQTPLREKEPGNNMQQLMSSLLSFGGSRQQSQAQVPQLTSDEPPPSVTPRTDPTALPTVIPLTISPHCRGLAAVTALIDIFLQLAFVDSIMTKRQAGLTVYIFGQLLKLLRTAPCPKARVAILQLLMRLRADRDHRIFFQASPAESERHVITLASQIGRLRGGPQPDGDRPNDDTADRARSRQVFERDGRRVSRGRGSRASGTVSRSRSRATGSNIPQAMTAVVTKPREKLWIIPDTVPFAMDNNGKSSQLVVSYNTLGLEHGVELPVSDYLEVLIELLKAERDWEVLSYLLVHLPTQLANKHFWCGPKTRVVLGVMIAELCRCIPDGTLGKYISQDSWPGSLKSRESQALAYHTLSVLISYHTHVPSEVKQKMVETFQGGLSGRGDSVIVCTHALTLCAFEMESIIVKLLPRILEKLSQIVSNPSMAVHILTFLAMLASLPHLYANFTENDFKMVFAVALQYLQHHNRMETLEEFQFSLSQHVRIMSYYVIYIWFLAVKLHDRPRHVSFIARQLLLANEGQERVDEPTEVCFDFIARYTYANADPKPAPSLLGEILSEGSPEVIQEKSWVLGYSIITIRLLAKPGWIEVISRRPSGMTKFLCKSENVPLVILGDPNPDMATIPASLMMDKDIREAFGFVSPEELPQPPEIPPSLTENNEELSGIFRVEDSNGGAQPDSMTGYVWGSSAPSQRRKRVDLDPAYFALQLSAYPDVSQPTSRARIIRDSKALNQILRVLDRTPVIDTHKVGILYVAPGQTNETEILQNVRGSPAYGLFLENIGRLIKLRGQQDVYTGGLEPDVDGEYAYAWWDDTGQILYHTATLMPNHAHDTQCSFKKRHIGNDFVRIVWNDSGRPYRFDTLHTEFQFVNIVIEPHSRGAIAAYVGAAHESPMEYFRVSVQCAPGMADFTPVGDFKIVSARTLPMLARQLSLIADWYAGVFNDTEHDTHRTEVVTNWRRRLDYIKKFAASVPDPFVVPPPEEERDAIMSQEAYRDFTSKY